MYGQFFGSYLLNRKAITPAQLSAAISNMGNSHIKLGTLAMYKGYMTSDEVDECCYIQRREDKRFGEIALERSYLFEDQLEDLLDAQIPDYLRLGQTLVDAGVLTNGALHDLMVGYNNENEYGEVADEIGNDGSDENRTLIEISNFFRYFEKDVKKPTLTYMYLILNNLVRFIGDDFTPLEPVEVSSYECHYGVRQDITGEHDYITILDMEDDAAVAFASRYADMEFTSLDDYVAASLEDFVNLHNGLFCVNLSNVDSTELSLKSPTHEESSEIELSEDSLVIPVIYPFGTIYIVLAEL